jgi:hypothetical protein
MKVGKNKIILYSWLPIGTYHKNLAIKKKILKFGEIGPFLHGKSYVYVEIIFFKSKFGEISPIKKTY